MNKKVLIFSNDLSTSKILLRFLNEIMYSFVQAIFEGECPIPTIFTFFSLATATLRISFTSENDFGSKYRWGWHSYV